MKYRPQIDGLRAIAIIFIILSHFSGLPFASGGVNIFFFISGYLITHIIENSNSLKEFYISRFNKLYKPMFVISLISIILIIFFSDLANILILIKSYFYSIFLAINFYLIAINNVYNLQNFINPFLPLWAFCVIFQFYIFFSIFLFCKRKILKKLKLSNKYFEFILIFIIIINFIFLSLYKDNIIFNFYSPISRIWIFLLGSFLYYLHSNYTNNLNKYLSTYGSILGILMIIFWQLIELTNLKLNYINIALLLSVASFLIIYCDNLFLNKLLTIQPLIFLGQKSFILYLIHMPIIYFVDIYFMRYQILISLSLIFLSIFLIFFTLRQNEK